MPCPTSNTQCRADAVATDSIIALQLPVAPAVAADADPTAAPSGAQPQLPPADSVSKESVGANPLPCHNGVAGILGVPVDTLPRSGNTSEAARPSV